MAGGGEELFYPVDVDGGDGGPCGARARAEDLAVGLLRGGALDG